MLVVEPCHGTPPLVGSAIRPRDGTAVVELDVRPESHLESALPLDSLALVPSALERHYLLAGQPHRLNPGVDNLEGERLCPPVRDEFPFSHRSHLHCCHRFLPWIPLHAGRQDPVARKNTPMAPFAGTNAPNGTPRPE